MQDSQDKADWMSFVLHFLFGIAVGAVLGVFTITSKHKIWLPGPLILPYLSGTALLVAGLGARWGDKLWMSSSESIFGSDAPRHNRVSKGLCDISILTGIALSATTLIKHFYR